MGPLITLVLNNNLSLDQSIKRSLLADLQAFEKDQRLDETLTAEEGAAEIIKTSTEMVSSTASDDGIPLWWIKSVESFQWLQAARQ